MFRPEDMDALRAIRQLVHERGMTLKGARRLLAEQGIGSVLAGTVSLSPAGARPGASPARDLQAGLARAFAAPSGEARLEDVLAELTDIKRRIDAARGRIAA
jgi:DNA-binding transcriptional MerR regulator